MNHISLRFAAGALAIGLCALASASTLLDGFLTADNAFDAYLSTTSGVQGVQIGTGNSWPTTYSLTQSSLIAGQDYYLQIAGHDFGAPGAFIGDFKLTGTDHVFSNGGANLWTDTKNWTVSNVSFAVGMVTPTSLGTNGVGPWGLKPLISPNAEWIWTARPDLEVFFETKISATAVPEPATMAVIGLAALALKRRRK